MSVPTQPSLSLALLSSTSFQATVSGADNGTTNTIYYRQIGVAGDNIGPAIVNNGSANLTGLTANASYLAWAVSDNGASKSLPAIVAISLATTDTISGAIVALFKLDPAIVALCPNLFANEIPETDSAGNPIDVPLGCVEVPDEVPEWNFEGSYYDTSQAKITLYASTQALADQLAVAFQKDFDWMALPFATVQNIQMMRTRSRVMVEQVLDRNGNRVFGRVIEYQVMVTRSQ